MGEFPFKQIVDYGVAIVGLVLCVRFLSWLIKYILERNKQREDLYMSLMTNDLQHLTSSMKDLTANITSFANGVNEAHRFQREEHQKQLEKSEIICGSMKQVELGLGRINGYKH